ncbi:DedA family protein [Streptomyces sp. NPDC055287]
MAAPEGIELLSGVSYGSIFLLLLLESTVILGLFAPGVFAVIGGAYLAGVGALSPVGVFLTAYTAVVVGDNMGFLLGRSARRSRRVARLIQRLEDRMGERKFDRPVALLFFQFPVVTRAPVPILLGAARMHLGKWLSIDAVATLLFISTLFAIGFTIGRTTGNPDSASRAAEILQLTFLGLLLAWGIYGWVRFARARRRKVP